MRKDIEQIKVMKINNSCVSVVSLTSYLNFLHLIYLVWQALATRSHLKRETRRLMQVILLINFVSITVFLLP
jgi:hypothetical protein